MSTRDLGADKTDSLQPPCIRPDGILFVRDLVFLVVHNFKVLLIVPVLAGFGAFAVANILPKWYTSVAYLTLDEGGARSADAIMHTPAVLDAVSRSIGDPGQASEARRKALDRNRRIVVAPGNVQGTAKLFRLEYSDRNPRRAQAINEAFISAWIEAAQPPLDASSKVDADLNRIQSRLTSLSKSLDLLLNRAQTAVNANGKDEIAVRARDLLLANRLDLANVIAIHRAMLGISRTVVFSEPTLPQEPSWPNQTIISILTAFVAGLITIAFVLLRASRQTSGLI